MNFVELIAPYAVKYMKEEGILASLTIAQAILESNFGKSELAVNANNLFGMKTISIWTGQVYKKKTEEVKDGKRIEIVATFCKFTSIDECFEFRSRVYLKRSQYKALWGLTDYKEACWVIWQSGYATEPTYPQKLIGIIEKYNLNEYDKEGRKMVKFFIDPGHGGTDSGAIGNGLQEKDLTLLISKKIRDLLSQYENTQIKLSRESDQTLALTQRTDMANEWGADFLLSVHINSGGGTGYEDYVYPGVGAPSTTYQNIIHEEILKQVDFVDRGKKQANFHMLRESNMPALLTENGFIDYVSDAEKLKLASFIEKIAQGHVNGIIKAFGLKKKTIQERKLSGLKPNWSNWQWEEAANIFKKAREKGIITSDQWEKKAAAKDLTFDDLEFLNLVLTGRVL